MQTIPSRLPHNAMRARRRRPHPRASAGLTMAGFTMIEMLIVVTLIAAISAMLMATIGGGMDGLRLRSAAKEIVGELRHARAQAMAKGEVQRFVIDPAKRYWTGSEGRSGELHKKLSVVFIGARELQPRRGEGAIVFFEDGASSGGRIQLRQGNAAWNVDVAWLTGEVGLHRARVEGTRAAQDDRDGDAAEGAAR